jgi:Tfp pilus assembly PilM family ATPase
MNTDKIQGQALQRNGDARSLEQALSCNIQHQNRTGCLTLISTSLFQRTQPISVEKLQETLQAALDLSSSEDLDFDFEFEEEFKALERSVVG